MGGTSESRLRQHRTPLEKQKLRATLQHSLRIETTPERPRPYSGAEKATTCGYPTVSVPATQSPRKSDKAVGRSHFNATPVLAHADSLPDHLPTPHTCLGATSRVQRTFAVNTRFPSQNMEIPTSPPQNGAFTFATGSPTRYTLNTQSAV